MPTDIWFRGAIKREKGQNLGLSPFQLPRVIEGGVEFNKLQSPGPLPILLTSNGNDYTNLGQISHKVVGAVFILCLMAPLIFKHMTK